MIPSVFISYGHADVGEVDWLERLRSYLAVFERQRRVEVWDDRAIRPGHEWREAIRAALEKADAAVLLVGPRFLASEFIANHELPHLLDAARSDGVRVYPVIVGFCAYRQSPLEKYQSFNPPDQPLEALPSAEQNRLLNELCMQLVQELEASPPVGEAAIHSQRRRIVEGLERERLEVVRQSTRERSRSRVAGQRLLDMTHSFKDREAARAELYRLLALPATHVVTVVGRAGIGKTALVSRLVGEIEAPARDEVPRPLPVDGIAILSARTSGITLEQIFVDCGRLLGGDAEVALQKLWRSGADPVHKAQGLLAALSGGSYVILLDHFDDLLDDRGRVDDEQVRAFLDACLVTPGSTKLLITSRIPLLLEGQARRFNVQVRLDEGLPVSEAIALLREFDPNGDSGLKDAPEDVLRQAVERLHGLPRALELLPSIVEQSPQHTLNQILDRFYSFDDVGHALARTAYEQLDATLHLVLQGLATFRRPMTVEALDFLLAPFVPRGTDVPGLVRRLVVVQMLKGARGERDAAGHEVLRVSMHPIDEDFTLGRIPEEGPACRRALERRAAEYYRQIRPDRGHWHTRAGLEPMLAEFDHLVRAGDYDEAAALLATFDEQYLIMGGSSARSLEMHRLLDGRLSTPAATLQHTFGQSLARAWRGALDEAIGGLHVALDLARQLSDTVAVAECTGYLGEVSRRRGRLDDALAWTSQAVSDYERLGDAVKQARWLNELSLLRVYRGEVEAAAADATRALTLARGKDVNQEALAHDALSLVHLAAGRHQLAVTAADAAIDLYRRSTWEHTTTYVRNVKGLALVALGQRDAGMRELEAALRQASDDHDARPEGLSRFNLSRVWRMAGDAQQALAFAESAAAAFPRHAGEIDAARQLVEVIRAEQRGDPPSQARALVACARASLISPDLCHPYDLAIEAAQIAQREALKDIAAEAGQLLGRLTPHVRG